MRLLKRKFCGRKVPIFTIAAIVGLSLGWSNLLAQSGAGSIQGTVTDSTGAVIPGASIHVVNPATNVAIDTRSNRVGFYQVPGLFTGTYVVKVTAPGMKTYERRIELLVAQNAAINPTMTPGAVTEQVEVSSGPVQLTTTDSGVLGSTLENDRINQLPMNGRNLITLTNETTPGLETCRQSPSCGNGLMPAATAYEVDGVTLESREFGGASGVSGGNSQEVTTPDPDSIQEVRVTTGGMSAQYATPVAGVMTTKSGTNSLHGSFFETARNNAFGIAKVRQDPANFAAPQYIRNEFGASVGGPIVISHLYDGKDKTFFFFAYERFSLAQTSYHEMTTPSTAMRNGDWSGLVNGSGVLQQLYDPATTAPNSACPTPTGGTVDTQWCRTPFLNNQIPITRMSPTAKIIYAITPPPTTDDNPLINKNLDARDPGLTIVPNTTFRLDHTFDERNRVYLRYTSIFATNNSLRSTSQPATIAATVDGVKFPANATGLTSLPSTEYATAAGFTHIFSPTFFSETILGQQWLSLKNFAGGSPLTDFEQLLGTPNNFGEPGFPSISSNLNQMNGTMYVYEQNQIISNLDENLTKISGKHQMQFGGRYRHERFGYLPNEQLDKIDFGAFATALENPSTNGSNQYAAFANTGYADADQFLGAAEDYVVNLQPSYKHFRDMEFDVYFQDNFHVAKNLTLNLGLRYEAHPAPYLKDGALTGFDFKNDAEVLGAPTADLIAKGYTTQAIITNMKNNGAKYETPQDAGQPSALMNNYNFNFLPRFGFAWQPYGEGTVIRGAYGIYLYPVPGYFSMDSVTGGTPFLANYTQSYVTANQSPDGLPNYLMRTAQNSNPNPSLGEPPVAGVNSADAVDTSTTTAILPGQTFDHIATNAAPDRVTEVNVTLEQPMKGNSALRLSWVYAHDANLWNFFQYNNHPTPYVWEMQTGTTTPNGKIPGTNTYAATATGPYDQTTWGSGMRLIQKTGWSTDNALQVNYQRLSHRGIAWQISYVWSKPMHTGGEFGGDGIVYPSADYVYSAASTMTSPYGMAITPELPPPPPQGTLPWQYYKALNRFEYYRLDIYQPRQSVKFNGIVDLPFGHGKRYLSNANRLVDEIAGGWQLAGAGNIQSQDFTVGTGNWGATNPIHVYKHALPIKDCRSGTCYKKYQWFNGYVAPTANANLGCTSKCVYGLPANWQSYQTPIDNTPGTKYYGKNEVSISLPGKAPADIAYNPGPAINPYAKTVLSGPFNWTADASLFKVLPITESVNVRINVDAFNVFNVQGENNPNPTDGTECVSPGGVGCSSANAARQLQFTVRLSF